MEWQEVYLLPEQTRAGKCSHYSHSWAGVRSR